VISMNISLMRQTLKSNNKALARALEKAKEEIKTLKQENLNLKDQLLQPQNLQPCNQIEMNELQDQVESLLAANQKLRNQIQMNAEDMKKLDEKFDATLAVCVKVLILILKHQILSIIGKSDF